MRSCRLLRKESQHDDAEEAFADEGEAAAQGVQSSVAVAADKMRQEQEVAMRHVRLGSVGDGPERPSLTFPARMMEIRILCPADDSLR